MRRTTTSRRVRRGALALLTVGTLTAGLGACSDDDTTDPGPTGPGTEVGGGGTYEATIRRTTDGVAHITGSTLADAAFGQGWAQGQDRTCDLADQLIKVKGERARWFGAGEDDVHLNSDISWRTIGVMDRAEGDFAEASPEAVELITAFTAGWNAHLDEVGVDDIDGWCAGEEWVEPLSPVEVYGYARSIALMASAAPVSAYLATAAPPEVAPEEGSPDGEAPAVPTGTDAADVDETDETVGAPEGEEAAPAVDLTGLDPAVASNGWALGSDMTESGGGMLLANPHFPWEGELRFWESHVVVPGQIDMYGAMLSGVPGIGIGFNDQFGWTHTVSAGARFTAYRLDLVPGSPTTYVYGDEEREMTSQDLTVEVLGEDGDMEEITHTAWYSHYGPILDFPGFGWTEQNTITYRDANIDNDEFLDQYLGMLQAQDLDEFIRVHEEVNGVPLFNTIATSADGRAWYADTSATPNLSEEAIARYEEMIANDPIVAIAADSQATLLDGSDPIFEWVEEEGARDPGLVPADRQPQLLRTDYVFNANDPFWVAHHSELLAGDYSILHGRQERPLSARTRQNLKVLSEDLAGGGLTLDDLTEAALANRGYMATQLGPEIVERCRTAEGPVPLPALAADPDTGRDGLPAATIDLAEACEVLDGWDGVYDLDRAGPALFREFLAQFSSADLTEAGPLWAEPFDPARPAVTPSGLAPGFSEGDDPVLEALARAVQILDTVGLPLDITLGEVQFSIRDGQRIPIHGGSHIEGVTNMVDFRGATLLDPALTEAKRERLLVGSTLVRFEGEVGNAVNGGTSFLMALSYGPEGPEAKAFLVYGNTEDRSDDLYTSVTQRFSDKDWRDVAFTEEDVAADTIDTMIVRG